VDQNTGGGAIAKGFARILSTSKSLVCTAFIADPGNNLPVSMVALTIIAKTKEVPTILITNQLLYRLS
jgi:hypothetical protein